MSYTKLILGLTFASMVHATVFKVELLSGKSCSIDLTSNATVDEITAISRIHLEIDGLKNECHLVHGVTVLTNKILEQLYRQEHVSLTLVVSPRKSCTPKEFTKIWDTVYPGVV